MLPNIVTWLLVVNGQVRKKRWSMKEHTNIPGEATDLVGCSVTGDSQTAANIAKCKQECWDNPDCVAFVAHPWGTMLKSATSPTEPRYGFETYFLDVSPKKRKRGKYQVKRGKNKGQWKWKPTSDAAALKKAREAGEEHPRVKQPDSKAGRFQVQRGPHQGRWLWLKPKSESCTLLKTEADCQANDACTPVVAQDLSFISCEMTR